MCGIVGYVGKRDAKQILLDGLKRLEYRGYDSAGLAVLQGKEELAVVRSVGKVTALAEKVRKGDFPGKLGIAHTRWATHGKPTEANAHPHLGCRGKRIAVVHNGIIENFRELRSRLEEQKHAFTSETDTEVIPHWIEHAMEFDDLSFQDAFRKVLGELRGTFGIAAISDLDPEMLLVASFASPIVIGIGQGEYFLASDPSAVVAHTRDVIRLGNGEMAVITPTSHEISTFDNRALTKQVERIDWSADAVEKGGYDHFMMKEIMEQPESLENTLRGRLDHEKGDAMLGFLRDEANREVFRNADRIVILACGTSYHSGLYGKLAIEEKAGIPVDVELASEFRYRKSAISTRTVIIAISQSGETIDTLEAVREAKRRGAKVFGVVNVLGSAIATECGAGVYIHAGPEIGVASTKAYTSQLTVMALLALAIGRLRGTLSLADGQEIAKGLEKIPGRVRSLLFDLSLGDRILQLAKKFSKDTQSCFYLGRKYGLPTALEGALKLKEISYVHAEAYAAGELKHGALALVEKGFPSVVICPHDSVYEKTHSAIEQILAREGAVIALSDVPEHAFPEAVNQFLMHLPRLEMLQPIVAIIPLQLFAYRMAVLRGHNPDQPRNLAKSVTVE